MNFTKFCDFKVFILKFGKKKLLLFEVFILNVISFQSMVPQSYEHVLQISLEEKSP
jgi:hypothetical protein